MNKGQWIKGSFFNTKNYFGKDSVAQKIIKSSVYKAQDNVDQGYKPNGEGTGVLYSWKNKPLAYYDIPTLNDMIFSRKLWEQIRSNPFIVAAIENHSFWGEDQHRDSSEVLLENVAIRVDDFHVDDNSMVLGDISLMDTPKGQTIYALAKTGAIGNSSRGFGNLWDRTGKYIIDKDHPQIGLADVMEDDYLAVDWDCVCVPAVPQCWGLRTSSDDEPLSAAVMELDKGLREKIASAIEDSYQKNPNNEWISYMFNSLKQFDNHDKKTFLMASSFNKVFKKSYPTNETIKSLFKK